MISFWRPGWQVVKLKSNLLTEFRLGASIKARWQVLNHPTSGFSIHGAIASPPPLPHRPFLAVQLQRCHPTPCLCMQLFLQRNDDRGCDWLQSETTMIEFVVGFHAIKVSNSSSCFVWYFSRQGLTMCSHHLTSCPGKSGSQAGLG